MEIAWPGARTQDLPAMTFAVERTGPSNFKLSGELDVFSGARLERAVLAAEDVERLLVLDLAELKFMDSSGLRSLIRLARSHEQGILVRHPQAPVRRALWITGFGRDPTLGIRVEDDDQADVLPAANVGSDFLRAT